ncbi:helix-turn-helix domain-containing protein [Halalkalibacillus halophilus]|uniref:helix-turn-helix domain-containing protein n=1 Tax=Halalkalibacillus halophilus TaxID=392827 RepID=UPI0003FB86A0|nr:helix-turn-helix transcriptional regulator [Halalkalibacillus halophilus]
MTKNHEDIKKILSEVPGAHEHIMKPSVQKGKLLIKRRMELGMTQKEVVEAIKKNGGSITQATLSRAEGGDSGITNGTFDKIVEILGGVEDIKMTFKDLPKRPKEITYM